MVKKVFLERFTAYAYQEKNILAAILIGSQARPKITADKYSDYDIILFVKDTSLFLHSDDWLQNIEKYHFSFIEETVGGVQEKRVLFKGALDADFIIVPEDHIAAFLDDDAAKSLMQKGFRILVDKIAVSSTLPLVFTEPVLTALPDADAYLNLVHDFWYHCIWTTKKILRGELWTAKFCLDSYMKWKLLQMIEWYEILHHGADYDVRYSGRYLETWADPAICQELQQTFAHYNKDDMITKLYKTMDLFKRVSMKCAHRLDISYPFESVAAVEMYLEKFLAGEISLKRKKSTL